MKYYQLDIFGNWVPVDYIYKLEKLDKQYKVKFEKYLEKQFKNNSN